MKKRLIKEDTMKRKSVKKVVVSDMERVLSLWASTERRKLKLRGMDNKGREALYKRLKG